MLLILNGAVFLWTGGAPVGDLADNFRAVGREGIEGFPVLEELPYSAMVLIGCAIAAVIAARGSFGRRVLAVGDNDRAAALSGVNVARVRTVAFVISATSAVIAGILLAGFAGVTSQVGIGLEFQAITAPVLGGTVLGGGRGAVMGAIAGALVLEALFKLLNLYGGRSRVRAGVHRARDRGRRVGGGVPRPNTKLKPIQQTSSNRRRIQMSRPKLAASGVDAAGGRLLAFVLAACGDDDDGGNGGETASFTPNTTRISSTVRRWKTELAQRDVEPEDFGAGSDPWVQAIEPELVDTSEYKTPGPWNICFSNAAVDNPWRVVGWQTMQNEVEALGDEIADFNAVDAEASDDKQISDIQSLTRRPGDCAR